MTGKFLVFRIIAAEVGYQDLALRYFVSALFVDLADRHNNTADGVHVASTGGVWSALVAGFVRSPHAHARIVDVDVSYPCDFETQMLEYSALGRP